MLTGFSAFAYRTSSSLLREAAACSYDGVQISTKTIALCVFSG